MKLKHFFVLYLLWPFLLQAQPGSKPLQLLYKLTDANCRHLLHHKDPNIQESFFQHLVDSTRENFNFKQLPFGYYLSVKANGEFRDVRLHVQLPFSVELLDNDRGFHLLVLDTLGNAIPSADVYVDKKRIPFNATTQSHRIKKWKNKEAHIHVKAHGMAMSYQITPEKESGRKRRAKRKKKARIRPLQWGRNLYGRIADWINDGGFWQGNRVYKGYIALSKPKYRPGDTLKVKAYIANKRGRPLRKTLNLTLGRLVKKVKPTVKGQYAAEIVLTDSLNLRLDRFQSIRFTDLRLFKSHWAMSQSFRYEDYELNEIEFSLQSESNTFYRGDTIRLKAEGKYTTGLRIPDGAVKVILKTGGANIRLDDRTLNVDEIVIHDTLWQHQQILDFKKATPIVIPDTVLPKVKIPLQAIAQFSNSNGELHQHALSFRYHPTPRQNTSPLQLQLDGAYLVARYNGTDSSDHRTAILSTNGQQQRIQLPYRQRLNPGQYMYKLASISSEDSTVLYLFQQPHLVKINGIHRHDSLIAAIENPRQLNIRYEIYRGKKLVDAGQTQEAYYPINRKASNGQAYRIKYFFGWGGNDYPKNQKTFFHYQKKLTIQIDQPQAIVPGEQMQVRVKVLDHRKKAAAGVNLLAGSVNAQFQNARQYKAPRLTYKVGKTPAVKHRKLKWKEPNSHYWQLPLDTSWIRRLKVEQDLFYRLRFPRKTIFAQLDTIVNDGFYRDKALFAPYVVRKGRSKKVYLIYCNRRLIYCSETSDQSPYVFNGQPGYNTIEVRTQDHSYTIDSVFLKAGHKLEISIDEDHILPHKHVKSKSKPDTLEQFEYNFLKKHLLVIRNPTNSPLYLIQGDKNIRRLAFHRFQLQTRRKNREELLFVGPFIQNVPLTYIRPNAFVNTFLFEPGFLYEIAPQRERLYPLRWPQTVQLKEPYHLYRPGALTYKPNDIRLKTSEYNIHYSPRKRYDPTAGRGSYQWKLSKEDTLFKALVFVRADTVYGVYKLQNRKVRNLDPGLYQAFFIAENGFYKQRDVRIEANALTFQNWAATILQRDSSKYLYDQITYSDKAQAPPPGSIQDILSRPNKILLKNFDEATRLVHGKVIDGPTGEAIAFASVFISGTSTGTTTDLNGDFELEVPAGKYIVEVHFLGYEAVKIDMLAYYGSELNVAMYERQLSLDNEITVTATGRLSKRRSNVYRRGSTPNYLDLKLAGIETENTNIRIRGINSLENNGYLTVIDGIPAASGIKTIERMQREGKIKTLELMPADQARIRFNLDKAIPAIIIQTYKDRPPSERGKESQSIRNNFRDYAYWQPNLMTDKKGEATFQVHFPDNVTQWNNFVMGMDKKQRVGLVRSKTNAVKQLLGQLALPRFLVEGDKSSLIGKAINYTADSFRIQTTFEQEGMVLQQKEAFLRDALIEKVSVQANERADSLTFQYRLQRGDYADGEERRIPILRRGVEENKGHFWVLESDTSFQLDFDPAYGPVYLRAESDQLQLMHFAASKLTVYPHDCNEQVASKLIALLLTKMVCKASGKPFKSEKQIKKAIKRLESTQANIGAWGWWKDNPTDVWMTSHVFRALFLAKQSGYAASSTRKALQYLTSYLDLFGGNELLNALEILTHQNQNLDYESYIHKAEKQLPNPSSYQKLVLWKLRQSNNLEWPVDSLLQSMKKTFYGGLYHPGDPRHWYNNHIQNTLLAYCILLNAGRKDLCQKIERYIIRENRNGTWGNTARTAQVLLTVLPELLKNRSNLLKNTNLQITTDESVNIHKFPYTHTIPPNQKIKIHKEGLNPLYLTAYQKRWEPTPKARANGFEVTSQLLQFGKTTKHLKTSETAQIKVSVTIEEKMEYIMVEVPIPAGCSYGPKSSRWLYRQRTNKSEVHREYFKDHVAIFCRTLPPGTHEFTIDLEARFDGHYTLNPATAQEMYFPTLNGRTNSKKVKLTP